MAKAVVQNKNHLEHRITQIKREAQSCIFPTLSERYCISALNEDIKSNIKPSETLHTSLLLKNRLLEALPHTGTQLSKAQCQLLNLVQILTFQTPENKGSRYFEYKHRKPKTGKRETHAQQQMCSQNAGHMSLWFLVFTHTDWAHACLHHLSFLRVSAVTQSYSMMADFISLSSQAPSISCCIISNTMAVMASTTKMRKFQTTFFGEESNKAALFKNI